MRDIESFNSSVAELISNIAEENRESVGAIADLIRDDYTEALGELSHYGEITDGKYKPNRNEEAERWKAKFEAERQRYIDRWTNGTDPNDDKGDDPKDKPVTITSILKEVDD